jgi:two-component system sensor histidine kinase KdpD
MSESSLKPDTPAIEAGEGQAARKRGKLRIFLGYAAGVGKTYSMLEEAQRLKKEGVDVVIGYFEPHARRDTIAKTQGLEQIPRKLISYRRASFEEMDTEGILQRSPQVCVVDEFAHTNVPGSEHGKRYEDVDILLDAGIDILTTLNVQHLESLNDQVWQVTGVRVRETIPDWVVERADEIVMVDVPPRALIHRLERGVVYSQDKAHRALENFFTETNLTALRELALRQTAHQVEDTLGRLADHRSSAPVNPNSPLGRVMIQLNAVPQSAMLLRRGKRLANYLDTDCLAVYVARDEKWSDLSPEQRDVLEKQMNFAKNMRIGVEILIGKDIAETLTNYARQQQVTQLIILRGMPDANRIVSKARDMVVTVVSERKRAQ